MGRFALIAFATVGLLLGCKTTDPDWGSGPITLSPVAQQAFDRYMASNGPIQFAISTDGRFSFFSYCPAIAASCEASYGEALEGCRRNTRGRIDCKILAEGHDIVWQGKITMASSESIRLLRNIDNAIYCHDRVSNTYYVVGLECLFEDVEVTRQAYIDGVDATLDVYCRASANGDYFRAKGSCGSRGTAVSKTEFDRSLSFCADGASGYYSVHGPCKPGHRKVERAEYLKATADKAR